MHFIINALVQRALVRRYRVNQYTQQIEKIIRNNQDLAFCSANIHALSNWYIAQNRSEKTAIIQAKIQILYKLYFEYFIHDPSSNEKIINSISNDSIIIHYAYIMSKSPSSA